MMRSIDLSVMSTSTTGGKYPKYWGIETPKSGRFGGEMAIQTKFISCPRLSPDFDYSCKWCMWQTFESTF